MATSRASGRVISKGRPSIAGFAGHGDVEDVFVAQDDLRALGILER